MERKVVLAPGAPAPIGPYSQAVAAGGFIFCSGQIPLDPATGALVAGDIRVQTARVLDNLEAVLAAEGSALSRAVKVTVYLKDLADFAALNEVFAARFPDPPPARAVVQAAALPKGAALEVDVIAVK